MIQNEKITNSDELLSESFNQKKKEVLATIQSQLTNRKKSHYGIYHDVGIALDKFSCFELYLYCIEKFGETSIRDYFENQITSNEISKELYYHG